MKQTQSQIQQPEAITRKTGNGLFPSLYQNNATRELDELFDLTGQPVGDKNAAAYQAVVKSTGFGSLGDSQVERVLSCFGNLALIVGNFVGVPLSQLVKGMQEGTMTRIGEGDIARALEYKDTMKGKRVYLKKENVDGIEVLFPQNLEKWYFKKIKS